MTPERWQHIDRLFQSALERAPEERASFVSEACANDESLRAEVESLIAAHEQSGEFLDSPAYEMVSGGPANDSAKLALGETLGHYTILNTLGTGGMGKVYLAQDSRLGRKVALKLLSASFTENTERVRRFEQEARAASALNHPNILTIHEIGNENGLQFIATEFIEGEMLRERMRRWQMKIPEALHIAVEVAEALAAAHVEGIVHRDIKPENIMLRKDGHVKVLDFGLAKLTDNLKNNFAGEEVSTLIAPLQSTPGLIMGTVAYMSPEQARGLAVDARTDIWSLGVVLYEMVAGRAPFDGATTSDLIASILKTEPLPLTHVEVPTRLDQIVTKALSKEIEERYQTSTELLDDLKSLKQELEFESQLEYSARPDSREPPVATKRAKRTAVHTDKELWARTGMRRTPVLTMSVEYLLNQITGHKLIAIVALAILFIVAAGVAIGWDKFFGEKTTAGMSTMAFRQTQVTKLATNGNPVVAAISPDGKYVAYALVEGGKQSLWVRQVDIASNHQIVSPAEAEYQGLTFSPDGGYVYYGTFNHKTGEMLYRVPVLGGVPTKVMEDLVSAKLSPDGSEIAFGRRSQDKNEVALMIAKVDGTDQQILASRKLPDSFGWWYKSGPAWSPDGKSIACAVTDYAGGPYANVLEVRIADRKERLLSDQRWDWIGHLAWLSDGSGLVMTAKDKEASFEQVWLLPYPSGEARKITNDLSDHAEISLTKDSGALVTVQSQTLLNIWSAAGNDPARAIQVTSGAGRYLDLSTAPDGKILYSSDATGIAEIWEAEADGTGQKQLTSGTDRNYGPSASADGRYIVFQSNRSGAWNIWRMDRNGGNQKQLSNGSQEAGFATCSPDSKWVIYSSDSSGKASLWKIPIDGGEPVQLVENIGRRAAISPDGSLIAAWYADDEDSPPLRLAVIPFGGGQPIKMFDIPRAISIPGPISPPIRWTPDGRALTYTAVSGESAVWGGVSNVWAQPLSGGPPKQITDFKIDRIFSFDWTRDGQLILSRGNESDDIVLIKDLK